VVALLVVSAPALSLRPYHPTAVDFELVPPPVARSSGRPVVSPPVHAPKRFNLVGLRWRGQARPAISIRVRATATGAWSRWAKLPAEPDGAPDPGTGEGGTPASTSSPAWAGDADWVQYRLSRPVPGLRLHFVNTRGNATPVDRAKNAFRKLANGAALALLAPVTAQAQEAQPAIQPRSAWENGQCPPRVAPGYGEVKAAIVHHTVSLNDYQPGDVPSIILGICRFHRNTNGWNDIGYNFLVDKFGTIWEGRAGGIDQAVVGAQAQGYNTQTTGIANIGDFSSVPQTDPALDAMARLIRWKLPLEGAPTAGNVQLTSQGGSDNRYPKGTVITRPRVFGHRDVDATECPGGRLYAQLAELRSKVGNVQLQRLRTKLSTALMPSLVVFPGQAQLSGQLRQITGVPLAGRRVEAQLYSRGRWHPIGGATSDGNGAFATLLKPSAGHVLRTIFRGDGAYLPSTSGKLTLHVRPAIALRGSVARASVGRTPTVAGTIQPAKSRLLLVIQRKTGRGFARAATLKLRAKKGRFRKSWRLRDAGLYRYRVVFVGDNANIRASSPRVYLRAVG
jgi:N-acetylmuramoyl-L-alanine amidase